MSIRNDQDVYVTQTEKLERLRAEHEELLAELARLRASQMNLQLSHDRLLAAAKRVWAHDYMSKDYGAWADLKAAIAAAEEQAP